MDTVTPLFSPASRARSRADRLADGVIAGYVNALAASATQPAGSPSPAVGPVMLGADVPVSVSRSAAAERTRPHREAPSPQRRQTCRTARSARGRRLVAAG